MSVDSHVVPLDAGVLGFDTNTKLTAASASVLYRAGFRFAIRYLSRKTTPPPNDLSADEVKLILGADLAIMAVQHVAKAGWEPSEELGIEYGRNAVTNARSAGLPRGTSIWLDLEGVDEAVEADHIIAYCNSWFSEVEVAGFTTGIYVGSNCGLTGEQLYFNLKTQRYWKSGSDVPSIPHRGWAMVQHIIKKDKVGDVEICRDVTCVDSFGNTPMAASRVGAGAEAVPLAVLGRATDDEGSVMVAAEADTILRSLAGRYDLGQPMERLLEFWRIHGEAPAARYWGIADFDLRSSEPRLFLFDIATQSVRSYLCAHGKGSEGHSDDGYAEVFSNVEGSNCTSLGVYRCAERYRGKHGTSMRLDGLEPTNSKARARNVVVHGANYVSPDFVEKHGRIGRSDGCLAVENRLVTEVVTALTSGSLLLAWHGGGSRATVVVEPVAGAATGEGVRTIRSLAAILDSDAELEMVWSELEPPAGLVSELSTSNARQTARRILDLDHVILAHGHVSRVKDDATAYQNITDMAAGRPARRSSYGNAPGGTVELSLAMLEGVVTLAEHHTFSISEFCGGSHNPRSRHYAGCAVDFNVIDGRRVSAAHPSIAAFRQLCRKLGATEILGPGDKGHSNHVHAGWPRNE